MSATARACQAQVATPDKFFDLFVVVFYSHAWYNRGKTILPVAIQPFTASLKTRLLTGPPGKCSRSLKQ